MVLFFSFSLWNSSSCVFWLSTSCLCRFLFLCTPVLHLVKDPRIKAFFFVCLSVHLLPVSPVFSGHILFLVAVCLLLMFSALMFLQSCVCSLSFILVCMLFGCHISLWSFVSTVLSPGFWVLDYSSCYKSSNLCSVMSAFGSSFFLQTP